MNTATRVEMSALVERLSSEDMPAAAGVILAAWCARNGVSHDSISTFVGRTIDAAGNDGLRHVLIDMLAKYETGLALGSPALRMSEA
jgi:hypothetical protein